MMMTRQRLCNGGAFLKTPAKQLPQPDTCHTFDWHAVVSWAGIRHTGVLGIEFHDM